MKKHSFGNKNIFQPWETYVMIQCDNFLLLTGKLFFDSFYRCPSKCVNAFWIIWIRFQINVIIWIIDSFDFVIESELNKADFKIDIIWTFKFL